MYTFTPQHVFQKFMQDANIAKIFIWSYFTTFFSQQRDSDFNQYGRKCLYICATDIVWYFWMDFWVDRPDPQDTEQGVVTNAHLPVSFLFVTSLDDPGT